jgi:hypothetical protein
MFEIHHYIVLMNRHPKRSEGLDLGSKKRDLEVWDQGN